MTEKETGNAQAGACVDVLPRCCTHPPKCGRKPTFPIRDSSFSRTAQLTEIAPPQPFLCVNRCPIRYDFRGGACASYPAWCEHNQFFILRQYSLYAASFPVVLGDFGCDVTADVTCQACRENSPRTPRAIALGSKPPLVTRIARTGLGTRLASMKNL